MKKKLSIIFSFFLFLTINIPSIKLFYSKEILNIAIFIFLFVIGLSRLLINKKNSFEMNYPFFLFLLFFLAMWFFLFLTTLFRNSVLLEVKDIFKYLFVIGFVLISSIFIQEDDVYFILIFQLVWSSLLSILYLLGKIKFNYSLGQHYLTLGVPIGASVNIIVLLFLSTSISKKIKLCLLPIFIINLGTVSSLRGRAPVILSISTPLLILLINLLKNEKIKIKFKIVFRIFVFLIIVKKIGFQILPQQLLLKIRRMSDLTNERRYYLYKTSLEIISNNIMGVGLQGYKQYSMGYPHNLFLEVAMSGGVISLLNLIFILIIYIKSVFRMNYYMDVYSIFVSLSLYYFLVWNLSFNLISSYIPFVLIGISVRLLNDTALEVD